MLVHNNSKESVLVRGVCHPSVLHTVQNDKGWVGVEADVNSFSSPLSCILVTDA